jgi:deoxyribonuclease IV
MDKLRLGAHMSISGGPANALLAGRSIACEAIQMFTRNANRWASKELTTQEISEFDEARRKTGIHDIVAHSSYLINLASPDDDLWSKSVNALTVELQRCQQLGIVDYVLHPGAHMGMGEETGLARIARGLNAALAATPDAAVTILLETTAGQGSVLGCRFEQLRWLIDHAEPTSRLGVCFDTCHVLVAGYEFRTGATYQAMWHEFDGIIGLPLLRAIHLNDSIKDRSSHLDRHEQIGKGYVGLDAFRMLVNDPQLRRVPMLLETPKDEDLHQDVENLAILRSLVEGAGS